jgi:hypothetical protein
VEAAKLVKENKGTWHSVVEEFGVDPGKFVIALVSLQFSL